MALSVMPDEKIIKFKAIVKCISSDCHDAPPLGVRYSIIETFCTAPAFLSGACLLLRRKCPDSTKPYMTFFLSFGHFTFQLAIASPEESADALLTFVPMAFLVSSSSLARMDMFRRDLNGCDAVKGESMEATLFIIEEADKVAAQIASSTANLPDR